MVLKTAARGSRLAVSAAALAVIAAACGGSDEGDGGGGGGEDNGAAAGSASDIQVETVEGMGELLVNSEGLAMYTADLEEDGEIVCSSPECLEIWHPVTLPEGETEAPQAPEGVTASISVVERPSGEMQLTLDGAPLYTFDFDEPGNVTGHKTADSFNGNDFVWFVATASGEAPEGGGPTPTDDGYVYY